MAYAVSALHTLDKPVLQDLDVVQSAQSGILGSERVSSDGRKYKYVVTDASCVASTGGEPAYVMIGTTANEVTSDYTDAQVSEQLGAAFAGVFCGTITVQRPNTVGLRFPTGP